jgi:AcrR family transcriptional regulator
MSPRAATSIQAQKNLRGPYAKTGEVRRRILEVCIEAFGSLGFHGTTMKDIARRAGISQTGLLHHFPTKADLLIGVLQERAEQEARIVLSGDRFPLISAQTRVISDNERRAGLIQLHSTISTEATAPGHPAHAIYKGRYDSLRLQLTREFSELAKLNRLRVETAPHVLADLYVAVIDGLQVQWLYDPSAVDISVRFRAFLQTVLKDA